MMVLRGIVLLIVVTVTGAWGIGRAAEATASENATEHDVLTIREGRFFLEGKPFGEISFNKFDLFWALWNEASRGKQLTPDNPMVIRQDKALRELHERGFRSIRFFALPYMHADWRKVYDDSEKREKVFYKTMDTVLDLCDRHDIKVVYCLCAGSFTDRRRGRGKWEHGEEHIRELVADPESQSRKRFYAYLEDMINRYKARKTILMWEITNELTNTADIMPGTRVYQGERMPTHKEVGRFYDDVAKRIKSIDPLRLVVNGGSKLRESAWNQYANGTWTPDTLDEHVQAYKLVFDNSALDVVDVHFYGVREGYKIRSNDGKEYTLDPKAYMEIGRQLKQPVIIGEYGALPSRSEKDKPEGWFTSYQERALARKWFRKAVDDVVEAEVPLVYWWCYQSDRKMDQNDSSRMDVSMDLSPDLVKIVELGNRKLKRKLGIGE